MLFQFYWHPVLMFAADLLGRDVFFVFCLLLTLLRSCALSRRRFRCATRSRNSLPCCVPTVVVKGPVLRRPPPTYTRKRVQTTEKTPPKERLTRRMRMTTTRQRLFKHCLGRSGSLLRVSLVLVYLYLGCGSKYTYFNKGGVNNFANKCCSAASGPVSLCAGVSQCQDSDTYGRQNNQQFAIKDTVVFSGN